LKSEEVLFMFKLCVVPLVAMLSACGVAPEGEAEIDVAQVSSALSSQTYSWSKGAAPVDMGPSFGRICFLSRISGDFEGAGEAVRSQIVNGRWVLSGTSAQASISASATCVYVFPSKYASWTKGQAKTFVQNGGACWLTSVSGQFNGGGEFVALTKDASQNWFFSGGSGAPGALSATAACVAGEGFSENVQWGSTSWGTPIRFETNPAAPKHVCGLQGMKGAFKGGGEWIEVKFDPTPGITAWTFRGRSGAASGNYMIGAWAGCLVGS
jgi:hypothetical protein